MHKLLATSAQNQSSTTTLDSVDSLERKQSFAKESLLKSHIENSQDYNRILVHVVSHMNFVNEKCKKISKAARRNPLLNLKAKGGLTLTSGRLPGHQFTHEPSIQQILTTTSPS